MKIVAFGDSITAGQYLNETDTYVYKLSAALGGCSTVNKGVPGNTTGQALERFESDVLSERPDVCIVQFGMNDHVAVARDESKTPLPAFGRNLADMCTRLAAAGVVPVLCTVHPIIEGDESSYYYGRHPQEWYAHPEGAQAWINRYNEEIRRVAGRLNVTLADTDSAWRLYLDRGGRLEELLRTTENSGTDDGVHPVPEGQSLYAACIADAVKRAGKGGGHGDDRRS